MTVKIIVASIPCGKDWEFFQEKEMSRLVLYSWI